MQHWYTHEMIIRLERQELERRLARPRYVTQRPALIRQGAMWLGCQLMRLGNWLAHQGETDETPIWIPTRRSYEHGNDYRN